MLKPFSSLTALMLLLIVASPSNAQTTQIPEVGAFLPKITDVKPGEMLPIDGLWSISSLDKIVRIDRGRVYAIEGWNHMLILKIKPGMVVITQLKQEAPGMYAGNDLPLQGPLKAVLTGDRILDVTVAGALGEVNYQLIPQELDEPEDFKQLVKQVRKAGR